MRRIHRDAPDVSRSLVQFRGQAYELVRTRWVPLTISNVAAQLMPLLVLLAALHGVGAFPESVTLIEVFAAYAIALLLTSFPITPGGLGTVDAALVGLLVAFGAQGPDAVAADLMWRLVWFLPQLLVGLGCLGAFSWGRRRARI
jgi:uncharacterized protein (TIRG00374 family)